MFVFNLLSFEILKYIKENISTMDHIKFKYISMYFSRNKWDKIFFINSDKTIEKDHY